jgi:hypothetical protein
MDIVAFFRFATAIKLMFEIGFEPCEESFTECSFDQYRALEEQGYDRGWRWFIVTRGLFEQQNNPPKELRLVDEAERALLLEAARWVHKVTDSSGTTFSSFHERMTYLKDRLPDALWGSAPPGPRPHLARSESDR